MRSTYHNDQHNRACKILGFALTLGDDPLAWSGLSTVLQARLSGFERSCILMAVVASMETEDVDYILGEMRQRQDTGMPRPPLFDAGDQASWWADHASQEESKAVLVAAFLSLPPRDREEFLYSASRRDAA